MKKSISEENLRELCLSNNWFSDCTSSQFDKLLQANAQRRSADELAAIIWVCSNTALFSIGGIAAIIRGVGSHEIYARKDQIQTFAERKVPADWHKWDIQRRREFWAMSYTTEGECADLIQRNRISAIEVWCELFNGSTDERNHDTYLSIRAINDVLASIVAWTYHEKPLRFGPYGVQRGFVRRTE